MMVGMERVQENREERNRSRGKVPVHVNRERTNAVADLQVPAT